MNELIGSVTVTPTTAQPGQPVLVQAHSPDGHLIDDQSDVRLVIDGMEAQERYLQLAAPGARTVYVRALRGEVMEEATAIVTVEGEPLVFHRGTGDTAPVEPALLNFTPDLGRPYTLRISIGSPGGRRALSPAEARSAAQSRGPQVFAALGGSQATAAVTVTDLGVAQAPTPPALAAYEWDFGDGTRAKTNAPAVTHDYFPEIDARKVTQVFHVACRVIRDNLTVKRTVALQSAYGLSKQAGVIVPHVEPDVYAAKAQGAFSGFVMVHNVEDQAITLTESAVVPLAGDPDAQPPAPQFISMQTPVRIARESTTAVATYVPADARPAEGVLGHDVPGFTVYYRGHADDGTPVRFSVSYEVPVSQRETEAYHRRDAAPAPARRQSWPWATVAGAAGAGSLPGPSAPRGLAMGPATSFVDPGTGTVALPVPAGADPKTARERMRSGFLAGLRQIAASEASQGAAGQPGPARFGLATPVAIAEGDPVDPDNISPVEAASAASQGLSPQLSEEGSEMVLVPGRFANALKGDVIISPGGPDMIGFLLRSLNPPQKHNHTGIMTQNYAEITHCTATGDRLADLPETGFAGVPTGIKPEALKYMWPGIITQTIDATVDGEPWCDETTGRTYVIQSFAPEPVGVGATDGTATPPLVIKPAVESAEVRQKLCEVADEARGMAARVDSAGNITVKSKGHYRLYGYTDPSIGLYQVAGPDAGWAEGTTPAVCSSFVWLCMRKKGMPMGGDPQHDGLTYYTADQRRAAAYGLHAFVADEIAEQQGWLGNLAARALGIADGIATQVLNTFACDESSPGGDPRNWQTTGDCYAVSPDNILSWLGPDAGGLYGHAEPVIYQEPHWEQRRLFCWTKSTGQGNLRGMVTADGGPIANARVQIYDGKSATSGPDGRYVLANVAQGRYVITASAVKDGVYYEVKLPVEVKAADAAADLALQPPSAAYRRASLSCSFSYSIFPTMQPHDVPAEQYFVALNPGHVTGDQPLIWALPDGHVARYKVRLVQAADNSLQATVEGWIYDGGAIGASAEKAHTWSAPFSVQAGRQVSVEVSLSASSVLPPWHVNTKLIIVIGNQQDVA